VVLTWHLYKRIMRRSRVIGLLALSAVPGLVVWLTGFDSNSEETQITALYTDIVSSVGYTYAIAALILTVATLRDERDSGTLPYIYMRPISRISFAAQSIAAGTAAALVIGIGGWLAAMAASLAVGAGFAIPSLALFAGAAVGYAAIFVPLGYLVPRSLLVGLGYIIVLESILANVVTGLAQFSVWRIALSIYAGLEDEFGEVAETTLGNVTPGVGGGVLKLAAVVVIGLGVLTWALKKRDAL